VAKYGKLWFRIWSDDDFTALDSRAQQLYFLLISYPTRTYAGVLPMTLNRWARATKDNTIANVTAALKQLAARRFVVVDWDTEEVLLRTFIRNDEVPKQANIMKSALDSAEHIQSPKLRWALYYELLNQPDDKAPHRTEEAANKLVAGLQEPVPEPLTEGLTEPLTQPLPEPPVVVTYLSSNEQLQLQPETSTAAEPNGRPGRSATPGATLVRRIIPDTYPNAIRTELRIQANALLKDNQPPEAVEAALQLWLTKTGVGPRILPALVADVLKTPTNGNRTNGNGGPKHKLRALAELANEVREMETNNGKALNQ
jgi:hypothetical protein